jgi:hypothetical protein
VSDWNSFENRFPIDLGRARTVSRTGAAGHAAISPTDGIEYESEKNSQE